MQTYTFVGLVDGNLAGKQKDATYADVVDLMHCMRCDPMEPEYDPCKGECTTSTFLRDLNEDGKAMLVETDEYGTVTSLAWLNKAGTERY